MNPQKNTRTLETVVLKLVIGIILIFAFLDISNDMATGSTPNHLVIDIFLSGILIIAVIFIIKRTKLRNLKFANLITAFSTVKEEAARSQQEKELLQKGLGECIDVQLTNWNLSEAEKEIALLLLKGFSHREIAQIRETSERTVRQQSLSIYSKSGLKGRSDLAAFFLEDMLSSIGPQKNPDLSL